MSVKNAEILTKGEKIIGVILEGDEGCLFIPGLYSYHDELKMAKGYREDINNYIKKKFKGYTVYDPDEILQPFERLIRDLWNYEGENI